MIIVQIPKDIKKIEKKVLFGLTVRQLSCLVIGGLIGVVLYFVTRALFHNSTVSFFSLIFATFPVFYLGMFEKDGYRLEQILIHKINKKIRPAKRPYVVEYIKDIREELHDE